MTIQQINDALSDAITVAGANFGYSYTPLLEHNQIMNLGASINTPLIMSEYGGGRFVGDEGVVTVSLLILRTPDIWRKCVAGEDLSAHNDEVFVRNVLIPYLRAQCNTRSVDCSISRVTAINTIADPQFANLNGYYTFQFNLTITVSTTV